VCAADKDAVIELLDWGDVGDTHHPREGRWLSHTILRKGHGRFLVLDGLYLHTPSSF
jgi:hypothetical protein